MTAILILTTFFAALMAFLFFVLPNERFGHR